MIKNPILKRGLTNASLLAAGNFLTQVISFVGFVFIARMLGAEDYGVYVTVGAFVGMFDFLLLTGLNKTILREGSKDVKSMHTLLDKVVAVREFLIIVAILACIAASYFTSYESQTKLYIVLFSFQLVYTGLSGFLSTIYQATEKMYYISIFSIANRIIFVTFSIAFLYLGFGLLSLFLVALFSNLSTLLVNYRVSRYFVSFTLLSKPCFEKEWIKPALVFSLYSFVCFLSIRIDIVMISFLGTSEQVGVYGVASRITGLGLLLLRAASIAFFPIFVKRFQKGQVKGAMLVKYSLFFFAFVLAVTIPVSFFCEDAVVLIFGSDYASSGVILKVLVFYIAMWWATLPFTLAIEATHNEKIMLIVRSIMAALNIPLNYILFKRYGLIGIAYSTLIVTAVGSLILPIVSYKVMLRQGYLH